MLFSQIACVVLTIISAIIIFVKARQVKRTHGLLGTVLFALSVAQVLLGAMRNVISGFDPKTATSPDDHGPR